MVQLADKGDNLTAKILLKQVNEMSYPLIYDMILLNSDKTDNAFLNKIELMLHQATSNDVISALAKLPVSAFLTTNYDFIFDEELRKERGNRKVKVSHIHGSLKNKKSIILGHRQYCSKAEHVNHLYQKQKDKFVSGAITNSWLDYFFLYDLHIIGLKMDVFEIDLWNILALRKEYINQYGCKNVIVFHDIKYDKTKQQLFKEFEVVYRYETADPINPDEYRKYYLDIINNL